MMLYEAVHFQHTDHFYHDSYAMPSTKMKQQQQDAKVCSRRNNGGNASSGVQRTKSLTNVPRLLLSPQQQSLGVESSSVRRGSYVVGQKLRESKWFTHDELKVFCAVVETGFVVQRKDDISEEIEYGVAIWNAGEEKSKDAKQIKVYSLHPYKNNFRVCSFELMEFWPAGTKLRIFNQCDKTEAPHSEEVIRDQIHYAETTKQKWHSTEHFTYWCRYGPVQISQRVRNIVRKTRNALSSLSLVSGGKLSSSATAALTRPDQDQCQFASMPEIKGETERRIND